MSIIVNSAWKNLKDGATVKFKGEDYTIGDDAFKSIEDAVDAGNTDDLVIVDKKLSSPVKKQNITGAATDIFAAEVTETESKDGKTTTTVTKFNAAAGGTASIKDEGAELNGFENVTAKNAGGVFFGGKQNVNITEKETDDSSKDLYTFERNANSTSTASGSLTASGASAEEKVEVFTGAIPDESETVAAGNASFASISLTNAVLGSANGGSITEKGTDKYSNSKDEKITNEWSWSSSRKVGSGTADLTDSDATALEGFKTVNITASKAAVMIGNEGVSVRAGTKDETETYKTSYEEDKSSSISTTDKETKSVAGTVNLTGKNTDDKTVTLKGQINRAAKITMTNAVMDESASISAQNNTENESISISVKQQKDTAALTASYSSSDSSTAAGTLTADKSVVLPLGDDGAEGVKEVSISASSVNGAFDAINFKGNYTKKETGSAIDGVTADQYTYVGKFGITYDSEEGHDLVELDTELVDAEEAYSYEWTVKEDLSAGGSKFQISGKTAGESTFQAQGYKSVSLDNTNKDVVLTADLDNNDASYSYSESGKVSFKPDSSYSKTYKETESGKAVGDAVITGNVAAEVDSFASVKISGENAVLNAFEGSYDWKDNTDKSWTVKAGKDNPIANYSKNKSSSDKGLSSLDASKMTLGGSYTDLKTAKLQNVAGSGYFSGSVDSSSKTTQKVTWNAEEISEAAALAVPGITDESVTAWSENNESQSSASGTFTLTNAKEELDLSGVDKFKSVKISGTIGKTTVVGVNGKDTSSSKDTKDLSVKGAKGTYSGSDSSSSKAATTLEISKATLGEGSSAKLKSVKATEVAGNASFAASLDIESKENVKAEWKADEITVAELAVILAQKNPDNEAITSANLTSESKSSVVGTLILSNTSKDAVLSGVSAVNFKSVDLTFAGGEDPVEGSLATQANINEKYSRKRTASDTKVTEDISSTWTKTAVASLKVTGKKANPAVIELTGEQTGMAYSSVTLADAVLIGDETSISAYDESYNRKESWSASLNSDEVTYKLNQTHNKSGKGTFTATITGDANAAYDGTLNGFKSITLKDKVSIGSADNFSYVGFDSEASVPFTEEYDTPMTDNEEGMIGLSGNISGSYTRNKNGDVSAKWNAASSRTASGSFTQTASVAGIEAGDIRGYDKVSLDGVASASGLDGSNVKENTVATFKYTKGDTDTNTIVTTTERTASSSATVSGRKFSGEMQVAEVGAISGYKNVTIENTTTLGGIEVQNSKEIWTDDRVGEFITEDFTRTAVGTLTATSSTINGSVSGFQTVKLSNTVTVGGSNFLLKMVQEQSGADFSGGNYSNLWKWDTKEEEEYLLHGEAAAKGAFTAEAKQNETAYAVGNVEGYQKVTLTNYSAGVVSAGFVDSELEEPISATYVKMTEANEDKDIPASWQKAAKTKGNTFTVSASAWKENAATVSVGGVLGYDKVEATNLASIGSIENAVITDNFGIAHYGDWTASSIEEEDAYTSIKVTAGASATITGQKNLATEVTGNVAGYAKIAMDKVVLFGDALYAAGDYSYTAKEDKNGIVTETESTKSNGTLQITNATADGAFISMTGFKTIFADIDGDVAIGDITGGTSERKYVDYDLESFTSTLSGSVDLTTEEGTVSGIVNGFESVTFTDTNFDGENARIMGHDRKANGDYAARTTVTFIDNDSDGQGQTIGGTIVDAREIVFKSKADDEVDFEITSIVDSQLGSDTKIAFAKTQATVDLSKFNLDEGDVIDLSSATIELSGDLNDLAAYFEQMSGSQITGSGEIAFSGVTADDVKAALDDADIKYAKAIKFTELA